MEDAYAKSKNLVFEKEKWMTEEWAKIKDTTNKFDTGVDKQVLTKMGKDISVLPNDGKFHN